MYTCIYAYTCVCDIYTSTCVHALCMPGAMETRRKCQPPGYTSHPQGLVVILEKSEKIPPGKVWFLSVEIK